MIHKEVILRDVEIPDGYEPTGEFRIPNADELFLLGSKVVSNCTSWVTTQKLVLRKIPQWRDPVLPADYGKKARFSDDKIKWRHGSLTGWSSDGDNDDFPWIEERMHGWKFCQVCDE
jgi:hypothetical protein